MKKPFLSIVIPVYNGEETIEKLHQRIQEFCNSHKHTYEVIFVWDCGPDNSWEVISQLKKQHPTSIKAIHLSRNFGQHNALICGFEQAQGEFIVTMDEDLQHLPEDIDSLIHYQKINNADVVYGFHNRQNHSPFRNITSNLLKSLIQIAIPKLHKNYSAFRLIKADIAKACVNMQNSYTFLDGYLSWITNRFCSCSTNHQKRIAGESSYTFRKLLRHSINIFTTFSDLPIKMVSWLSISFLLFAISYSGYVFIQKTVLKTLIPGYASTIILLSLGFGSVLFALGIIGQYIHRINLKTTKQPNYHISENL
ncbi:MAG: glycosyltransferase family 2 protein [Marinilabiliaceae bacterium]|nr:glycosyltransferase family 2 protein [Marinilabiliaceae bacterium]